MNFLKDFYPTPQSLINKMLSGIDFMMVGCVLEPSAGKGDLAAALHEKLTLAHSRNCYSKYEPDLDCIEKNPDLQQVLKGNGYRVVHDDFLTYSTYKKYDLIVMNPPFSEGDKHLLKAIELMENGGAIVCLLNAETIRATSMNYTQKKLLDLLLSYDADITYLPGEFRIAERKTDVEVVLVKIIIPQIRSESLIFETLKKAQPIKEIDPDSCNAIASNDFVRATVDRFNLEAATGIQLIRDYKAMSHTHGLIKLIFDEHRGDEANENEFLRRLRKNYWQTLFLNPKFTNKFTSNLLESCRSGVDRLADYDFSEFNIRSIQLELSSGLIAATEATIVSLFDELTDKHSWYDETSKNRHYFDGWYTNKCWIINKKVILPMQLFGYLVDDYNFFDYKAREKIADIDKTLRYLAWYKGDNKDVMQVLDEARSHSQTKNIQFDYFTLTAYKKGTVHITFTDAELLKKFNLFGCQKKNWLPPTYGRKRYADMNEDEKKVIDSFEGEESYTATFQNSEYMLSGIKQFQLGSGIDL